MILIVTTKATNGLKGTPNPMTSPTSTAAKGVTKPLTVGLSRRPMNYSKNANDVKMMTLVRTLHKWKN
jgi:hypothetical protein